MKPEVWVSSEDHRWQSIEPVVRQHKIVIVNGNGEPLRLQFPVSVDTVIKPEMTVQVLFKQQYAAKQDDTHHWVAFGVTEGFTLGNQGFEEQDFGIIPHAEATPWSKRFSGDGQANQQNVALRNPVEAKSRG